MSEELDNAREEIVNSMIGLCDFTITVPLSEKTRNIHTDTFIYLEPLDFMDKIDNIYTSLTNKSGTGCKECKLVPYRKGYWYVKAVKIKYDTEQSMTLTLAPLPTVYKNTYSPTINTTTTASKATSKKTTKKTSKNVDDKTLVKNALEKVGKKYGRAWKYTLSSWGNGATYSDDPASARRHKQGDCWACSWVLAQDLNKEGVTTQIKEYATNAASNHRTVQYRLNKKWYNFPYRTYHFYYYLNDTSGVWGGRIVKRYKGKT